VHVLVTAGAALLLAGCSSQPNDLRDNRYYGDAETTPPAGAPVPSVVPRPAPAVAPTTQEKPLELDRFALTVADLATEGVQQSGSGARTLLSTLPDCNVPLLGVETGYQTVWAYPTGATLRQYVAEFDGDAGDVVDSVREKLTCGKYRADGADVTVRAPVTAADGQVSWCATSSKQSACTVLKSDGSLLSVVVVTASTETKAKTAVTRIAPLAATALARNS
jgi:hypothetical protein